MANILSVPVSGSIYFNSATAGSSVIPNLTAAVELKYDNYGGLVVNSYSPGVSALDRFSVDGSSGRLFSVSDALTGSVFSVNDAAGLPIIDVYSDLTDIVNIGTYGTNALVISGSNVGVGTNTPADRLTVVGNTTISGTLSTTRLVSKNVVVGSGTTAIDWSLGDVFFRALTASTTFTFTNSLPGQRITVAVSNTAANYTVTWPSTLRWPASAAPVQTTGVKIDLYTFTNINNLIYGIRDANY